MKTLHILNAALLTILPCVYISTLELNSILPFLCRKPTGDITSSSRLRIECDQNCNFTGIPERVVTREAGSTGDALGLTVAAQGGPMAPSHAARASERLNIRDFGAQGGGNDDSGALAAAVSRANSVMAAGTPTCIYVPPGVFTIGSATPIPRFGVGLAGCVVGDGATRSFLRMTTDFSGDLFSWRDAWSAGMGAGTTITKLQQRGPRVSGLAVVGDQAATGQQNAFMFYNHNDMISFHDVDAYNVRGRVIYAGGRLGGASGQVGYIRESRFFNIRAFGSGRPGVASIEITSQCILASCVGQDASNEVDASDIGIYAPRGPGLVVRNEMPANGGTVRQIRMARVRLEGAEGNPNNTADDLMTIGDAAQAGPIANVTCMDCESISPYTNYSALRISSVDLASAPSNITWIGLIAQGGGGGAGLRVDSGRNLSFRFAQLATAQTALTVASSATVAGTISIDGGGQERSWTYNVDPTSVQSLRWPGGRWGVPVSKGTSQGVSAQIADGTVNGGNLRGHNSVDMQTNRFANIHAATGANSVISGGSGNAAANDDVTVSGGNSNTASGYRSAICGGFGNTTGDLGQYSFACGFYGVARSYGQNVFASGRFAASGDAQASTFILRGAASTAKAFRLTADQAAASSTFGNCIAIQDSTAFSLSIRLVVRSYTKPAKSYTWVMPAAILLRGIGTASTTLTLGTAATIATGSFAPSVSATADTTNACLNLTVTPPAGNTDTLRAVARVESAEVQ